MEIHQENREGVVVLRPLGRLDELATRELEEAFAPFTGKECPRLVLDLAGVEYVSSSGLRVLLLQDRLARKQGGKLKFACLAPFVAEVFEVSNLGQLFEVYPRVDDALAAFELHGH